jgi:hypothetical protein
MQQYRINYNLYARLTSLRNSLTDTGMPAPSS